MGQPGKTQESPGRRVSRSPVGRPCARALSDRAAHPCRERRSFSPRPIPGGSIPSVSWHGAGFRLSLCAAPKTPLSRNCSRARYALGAPLIAALFPRAYVDANRAASELDNAMFDAELGLDVAAPSARVAAGLGVIPRIVRDGAEIYREKLQPHDAEGAVGTALPALSRRFGGTGRRNTSAFRRRPSWWIAIPCRRPRTCRTSCWATATAPRRRQA